MMHRPLPFYKALNKFRLQFCMIVIAFSQAVLADDFDGIPAGDYELDLSHGSVIWKVNHLGFSTYVGRFTDFSAKLQLVPEDFSASTVNVIIQTASIDTAYPWTEKEDFNAVLANDWLLADQYPTMTFVSTGISDLTDGSFTVTGELTMAGQTQTVSLDAQYNKGVAKHPFKPVAALGFSASTTIDRTQWGVSKLAPAVGAQVRIEIEGEFLQTLK